MSSAQYKRKIDSGDDPKEQQLAQLKIENGESISFKKKRSRLENVLLALVLVLTVLCIVFIVLYATKSKTGTGDTKSNAGNGTNSGSQGGGTGGNTQGNSTCNTTSSSTNICTSADCVTVASGVLKSMDRTVKPCDDFYQYACGGWMKNNPIPDSRSRWSQFSVLYRKNEDLMKKLITSAETRKNFTDNEAVMKAFRYYDACMNEDEIESLGGKPLIKVITEHGAWSVTNTSWDASSWNFMENFVKIQKHLSVSPLFNMYVGTDLKESTQNIIIMDQTGAGISRESFLFNTSHHIKVRAAYRKLMDDVVNLLYPRENSSDLMQEVYNFEAALISMTMPREQRRDSNKLYNKMTLREFIKRVGNNSIDWLTFLQEMFKETGYKITLDEPLVISAEEYLRNMSQLFEKTDKRTVANYIMWQVVRSYAGSLSKPFRDVYNKFNQKVYGTKTVDPRWQTCMSSVTRSFGMAMGLLFVEQKFTGASKTSAEEMIHGIRQVFIKNLKTLDWMDDETKEAAKEKAEGILENIGYPDYLTNKTALAQQYEGFTVDNRTYFANILQKNNYSNVLNYAQIGKPVDRLRWSMSPPVVNAYYSPSTNKIVFPAGILQDPFYDHIFPKSLNYGGIGMVVGHEITHGFDDNGRKFNKEGNLVKWWTNTSIENFKKKVECLVEQYGNYSMFGKKLNGRQTLGENIADNGGIKQSYQAYQNWVAKHGEEAPLPGLDLTHNQLFFVSFAQIWCSSFRETSAIYQIETGVHSLGRYRVIGSLSNMAEFLEAFKCGPDTPMNKKKKCSVW